tara:strand:- start:37 stop:489 length:453 start_codon:yes stop_codon:yes gene_type:complete
MILKRFFAFVVFAISMACIPYSYPNAQTKNEFELLGQSISFLKDKYSCAPTMISGPSKRKIICADSNKKLISHAVKNRLVHIEISEFTSYTSVSDLPINVPASCSENLHSNLKTEYTCENQKTLILELDLDKAELKRQLCFLPFCYSEIK